MVVPFEALEELDNLKRRHDQKGYYARQAIRHLGDLQDICESMTLLDHGNTVPSVIDEMCSRNEVSIQKIGYVILSKAIRNPIAFLAVELL